jgi:hypothetical protein
MPSLAAAAGPYEYGGFYYFSFLLWVRWGWCGHCLTDVIVRNRPRQDSAVHLNPRDDHLGDSYQNKQDYPIEMMCSRTYRFEIMGSNFKILPVAEP